jgi:fructose-1,6-bisphosphatase/inositol monophosphatase family enzyme
LNNCFSLDLAYLAAGKIDLGMFDKKHELLLRPALLMVREAGGIVKELDGKIKLQ